MIHTRRSPLATCLLVPACLAVGLFLLPWIALLVRAPWNRFLAELGSPAVLSALRLSLVSSFAATLISLTLGLPLALWLASGDSPVRRLVRILVFFPLVLPPVVAGLALLLAFGRNGLIGSQLERAFSVALPFTLGAVVLAQAYVAMPFFVLTVEAGLRSFDRRYAAAAATLGAGPLRTLRTVTLPMIAPSLKAGLVVAWARSLGEFGATITFAGNLEGTTRTLPLAVYSALETRPDAAIVLGLIQVAVAALLLFLLRERWFPVR